MLVCCVSLNSSFSTLSHRIVYKYHAILGASGASLNLFLPFYLAFEIFWVRSGWGREFNAITWHIKSKNIVITQEMSCCYSYVPF